MSTGNWADQTDIFQACVHFLPVYLACPTAYLLDLLLFLFAEILFPDIFSFYHLILKKKNKPQHSNLSHASLYSLTFNICVQSSDFQSCSEGNSSRGSVVQRPPRQPGEQEAGAPVQLTFPPRDCYKMILCPSDSACLAPGSFFGNLSGPAWFGFSSFLSEFVHH